MVTINSIENSFISIVQNANNAIRIGNSGTDPLYPLIVVYLGNETSKLHEALTNEMFQVWPAYKTSIEFLHVTHKETSFEYRRIKHLKEMTYINIEENEVSTIFTDVLGEDRYFSQKNSIFVHFILESDEILSGKQLKIWFDFVKQFKQKSIRHCVSMLTILLNESTEEKIKVSYLIQNELSKCLVDDKITEICDSVYLLSNDRYDGTLFNDWSKLASNIIDIIILSVSELTHVRQTMYSSNYKIFYTSFNRVEKPIDAISKIVVKEIVTYINNIIEEQKTSVSFESIKDRILIENGIFSYVKEYIENKKELLPTSAQLNYFPRNNMNLVDLSTLDVNRFNQVTMNSWTSFFKLMKNSLLTKDDNLLENWKVNYFTYLLNTLDNNEKSCLYENKDKIITLIKTGKKTTCLNIIDDAISELQLSLSSDENVISKVIAASIDDLNAIVQQFYEDWENLVKELTVRYYSKDDSVISYYTSIIKNYLNGNHNIVNKVKKCSTMEDIEQLFIDIMKDLVETHPVFKAPFDEEIQQRLGYGELKNAIEYIKNQMMGDKVLAYFSPNFSIAEPQQTIVLIKTGTSLHQEFRNTLKDSISYYNIGVNYKADVIRIHGLVADDLRKSGVSYEL